MMTRVVNKPIPTRTSATRQRTVKSNKSGKEALGVHILLEFHGCPSHIIEDSDKVKEIFLEAARISRAHIVDSLFHKFNPHGVSGIIVIAESHFAVHTWPEYGYASIDLFSCSKDIDFESAIQCLKENLKPKTVSTVELKRGVF